MSGRYPANKTAGAETPHHRKEIKILYYYDDDSTHGNRWLQKEFDNQDDAIKWAEEIIKKQKPKNAILYIEIKNGNLKTIKIW